MEPSHARAGAVLYLPRESRHGYSIRTTKKQHHCSLLASNLRVWLHTILGQSNAIETGQQSQRAVRRVSSDPAGNNRGYTQA